MDIKKELKCLVVYVKSQQDAEASRDAIAAAFYRRFVRQSLDGIDRWADMAEAAIAYAEYQASNPGVEAKDYFREQRRLWDAFMAAHKAAKDVNQS